MPDKPFARKDASKTALEQAQSGPSFAQRPSGLLAVAFDCIMRKLLFVAANKEFWRRHTGLVWSNPQAEEAIYIRAALLHPLFTQLLAIALQFGLDRLKQEWQWLEGDETGEVNRARPCIERIFGNIEEGFALTAAP